MNRIKQIEIPKKFWKYYDLYRRGKMTVEEFSKQSGLAVTDLLFYLSSFDNIDSLCYNKSET